MRLPGFEPEASFRSSWRLHTPPSCLFGTVLKKSLQSLFLRASNNEKFQKLVCGIRKVFQALWNRISLEKPASFSSSRASFYLTHRVNGVNGAHENKRQWGLVSRGGGSKEGRDPCLCLICSCSVCHQPDLQCFATPCSMKIPGCPQRHVVSLNYFLYPSCPILFCKAVWREREVIRKKQPVNLPLLLTTAIEWGARDGFDGLPLLSFSPAGPLWQLRMTGTLRPQRNWEGVRPPFHLQVGLNRGDD